MSIEQEFEALRESTRKQTQATHAGFQQKNDDLAGMIERKGVFIEYIPERDHLYITLGEPQAGMALFAGSIVLLADPETLEFLGLEVPDFKKIDRIRCASTVRGHGWPRSSSGSTFSTYHRLCPVQMTFPMTSPKVCSASWLRFSRPLPHNDTAPFQLTRADAQ